jgi:hypothetical protein
MPLPNVPTDFSGLDASALALAYQGIAGRMSRGLKGVLDANTAAPDHARVLGRWTNARDTWSGLPAHLDLKAREPFSLAVTKLNAVEAEVMKVFLAGAAPSSDGTAPPETPLGIEGMAALRDALDDVRSVARKVAGDDGNLKIMGLFGQANLAAVKERFARIPPALDRLFEQTTARSAGGVRGFQPGHDIPATMGALAYGSGPDAFIKVSLAALRGPRPKLAATLVHEGSHILDRTPTVDFAYRDQNALYLLSPTLALDNAPHYEQLALNLSSPENLGPMPTGDLPAFSLAVLRSKTTRAWVRAYAAKTNPQRRGEIAELIGARADKIGEVLAGMLFGELFASLDHLMKTVLGNAVLEVGGAAELVFTGPPADRCVIRVPASCTTPAAVSGFAAELLTTQLWQSGGAATESPLLTTLITDIQKYDDGPLQDLLARFYQGVGLNKPISNASGRSLEQA